MPDPTPTEREMELAIAVMAGDPDLRLKRTAVALARTREDATREGRRQVVQALASAVDGDPHDDPRQFVEQIQRQATREERERILIQVAAAYNARGSSREERLIARGISVAEAAIRAGDGA